MSAYHFANQPAHQPVSGTPYYPVQYQPQQLPLQQQHQQSQAGQFEQQQWQQQTSQLQQHAQVTGMAGAADYPHAPRIVNGTPHSLPPTFPHSTFPGQGQAQQQYVAAATSFQPQSQQQPPFPHSTSPTASLGHQQQQWGHPFQAVHIPSGSQSNPSPPAVVHIHQSQPQPPDHQLQHPSTMTGDHGNYGQRGGYQQDRQPQPQSQSQRPQHDYQQHQQQLGAAPPQPSPPATIPTPFASTPSLLLYPQQQPPQHQSPLQRPPQQQPQQPPHHPPQHGYFQGQGQEVSPPGAPGVSYSTFNGSTPQSLAPISASPREYSSSTPTSTQSPAQPNFPTSSGPATMGQQRDTTVPGPYMHEDFGVPGGQQPTQIHGHQQIPAQQPQSQSGSQGSTPFTTPFNSTVPLADPSPHRPNLSQNSSYSAQQSSPYSSSPHSSVPPPHLSPHSQPSSLSPYSTSMALSSPFNMSRGSPSTFSPGGQTHAQALGAMRQSIPQSGRLSQAHAPVAQPQAIGANGQLGQPTNQPGTTFLAQQQPCSGPPSGSVPQTQVEHRQHPPSASVHAKAGKQRSHAALAPAAAARVQDIARRCALAAKATRTTSGARSGRAPSATSRSSVSSGSSTDKNRAGVQTDTPMTQRDILPPSFVGGQFLPGGGGMDMPPPPLPLQQRGVQQQEAGPARQQHQMSDTPVSAAQPFPATQQVAQPQQQQQQVQQQRQQTSRAQQPQQQPHVDNAFMGQTTTDPNRQAVPFTANGGLGQPQLSNLALSAGPTPLSQQQQFQQPFPQHLQQQMPQPLQQQQFEQWTALASNAPR